MISLHRFFIFAGAMLAFALGSCGSPLVGLECRDGLDRCGRGCYDLSSDESHCGGCNIACTADQQCIESACKVSIPPGDGGSDAGDGGEGDGGDASVDGGGIDGGDGGGLDAGDGGDGGAVDIDAQVGDGSMRDGQTGDGALGDGDAGDGSMGGDGAPGDGAVGDGALGDGGITLPVLCTGPSSPEDCVCDLGQLKCGTICVDANTDPENCGACGAACEPAEYCAAGICAPICAPPLTLCTNICVNLGDNNAHCGTCEVACGVGAACIEGQCVGRAVGHVVIIGHDMSAARAPMQTMVGNAVFLVRGNPLRVLAYDENTASTSRAGVSTAIQTTAQTLQRSYAFTNAQRDRVGAQLANADAFVIMTQHGATDDQLRELGSAWSAALATFLFRGGVILLFDAGGANGGTHQILESAGLMSIDARTGIPRSRLALETPSDAVASAVPTEYQSEGESAGFDIDLAANPGTVVVVRDPVSMLPIVLHKVIVE